MPPLTTSAPANELLQDTLVTLEQVTTSLTVLAINASASPEQSPRVRALLGDLLGLIQECEAEMGTYQSRPFEL